MSGEAIKPGYKRTEVGVIPEEWDSVKLTTVAKLESGHTPSRRIPRYWNGTIPWVSLHDTDSLDGWEIQSTHKYVTQEGIDNSSARVLPKGTVVFSRTATVGKSTVLGQEMATSQDFANYICGPLIFNHFLVYLFRFMAPEWRRLMAGSIHNTVYMPVFEKLKVVMPPRREQESITAALSDVDSLLAKLDQLIAKKRDLKQATMQQLLTGQTRLPGFSGEWEVKRLGDFSRFLRNGAFSRAELEERGSTHYLHYGDIHASISARLDAVAASMPYLSESKAKTLDRLECGDLVFADASEDYDGLGKSVEISNTGSGLVSGLHTIAIRFQKSILADGFKAYLQFIPSFRNHLLRLASGTKVYATQRSNIASAELKLPPAQEQTAIATVLSDMDAELATLESRREKTQALKQGMMQELLTGRIRLV